MKIPLRLVVISLLLLPLLSGCLARSKEQRLLDRAESEFKAGNYEKAKITYMQVIGRDAHNPLPFQRIGAIWLEEGDPVMAGGFLKRGQELDPNNVANNVRLAKAYQTVGQFPEARKEAEAVLKGGPNDDALILLAEIARTAKELEDFEHTLKSYPAKETVSYHIAVADLAARRQDWAAAETAVNRALELNPKSAQAHQAAGLLILFQKKQGDAGHELRTAAELAPSRSEVQMTYANYLLQTGQREAAGNFLDSLTKKAPDFLPAWITLARIAMVEKKYDDALKLLDNVTARDPRHVEAGLMQSDCFIAKRDTKKATEKVQRILGMFPELPAALYRLAETYLQQNKPAQAAAALDDALKRSPDYVEAIVLRAQLNVTSGQFDDAIKTLEQLLKKKPDLKTPSLLLAQAYRGAGRFDDAARIFRQQIELHPKSPEFYLLLGIVQEQAKKNEEARKSFDKALELAPDNLPALSQLVDLDLAAKDFANATKRVEEQLQKRPNSAPLHVLRGKVLMAQSHWPEAETALKKAIELDSTLAGAYSLLVSTYLTTHRLDDAAREMEGLIAKAPRSQNALMLLAAIREKQKDYTAARVTYQKLLAMYPDFVPALNNLAYLDLEYLNQLDEGADLAQKARGLAPADPTIADTAGWALYKKGDYDQAVSLLRESAEKMSDNSEVRFHLGMTQYMMGNTDAARIAFQQVVAAPGDAPVKAAAAKRLALLGSSNSAEQPTIAELESMVSEEPKDVVAILWLAGAYEKKAEPAKAAALYEAALKVNPKLTDPPLKLAQLYSGPLANKDKALTYAKRARELSPQDAKTGALLGRVAFDAGDTSWGYSVLQESARQLPLDAGVAHDLAWAAYAQGRLDEARREMQRCLTLHPEAAMTEDANSFLTLTALGSDRGTLAQARPQVEAKLQANQNYLPAIMAAAALDLSEGKRDEAMRRYQEALARFPSFAPAQVQLASLYLQDASKLSMAYALASQARKTLAEDATAAQVLGEICYERKEYGRAMQLLKESAREKPLDATGRYYLGMTYKEQKQSGAAIEELTAALAAGLPPESSRKAQQALIELRMGGSDS